MDPRIGVIARRLDGVRRIIAVTGGKGGIGKSLIASTLALTLSEQGRSAGLLDFDVTGPCGHVILGVDREFPKEDFGLRPPSIHGVPFMSIAYFTRAEPAPLRGADVSNALIELLTITRWGELEFLVIDMPPGLGDTTLDVVRLLPRAEYLVVATASQVVVETVRRTLRLLTRLESRILGCVDNMHPGKSDAVEQLSGEIGVPFLGTVPFDDQIESAVGDPGRLLLSPIAAALRGIGRSL